MGILIDSLFLAHRQIGSKNDGRDGSNDGAGVGECHIESEFRHGKTWKTKRRRNASSKTKRWKERREKLSRQKNTKRKYSIQAEKKKNLTNQLEVFFLDFFFFLCCNQIFSVGLWLHLSLSLLSLLRCLLSSFPPHLSVQEKKKKKMGSALSRLFKIGKGKEHRIVMLGLDNAGKVKSLTLGTSIT